MGLWRAIVGGFGFTLGARAADAALEEAGEALEANEKANAERKRARIIDVEREMKDAKARAAARVKAKAVAAREVARGREAAASPRAQMEIERELAAMKKRLKSSR